MAPGAGSPPAPARPTRAYALYALGLLAAINLLNYLDRNVIFALFEPIKRELALSDTQLGWLGSAYILVYSLAALPFGILSDLRSRRAVIAGGVAVWSAFTFLGGLVRNFWQLFACRSAVGIGEAAFAPAASSLVADYFPGKGRAAAMGVLSSGLALGGVLGLLLGGLIEARWGWRVAFMVVGVPGFLLAVLAGRIVDPTRAPSRLTFRGYVREFEVGVRDALRQFHPLLLGVATGAVGAWVLDRRFGAGSRADVAFLATCAALGLAWQVLWWVVAIRRGKLERTPFGAGGESAFTEVLDAVQRVLRTPTLGYVFVAGAMISFGMNGIVGWGPAFVSRALGLASAEAARLLGLTGLVAGTLGTLAGGFVADSLQKRTRRARVLTVGAGFLVGGPLALWLMTVRDPGTFRALFAVAFFFLSWYNGPLNAIIFDVVPSRVGATVAGAYFLFIHIAGDAIAFPLVGALSDRFGLEQAVLLLPAVALVGGVVVLLATRVVVRDMDRLAAEGPAPARR